MDRSNSEFLKGKIMKTTVLILSLLCLLTGAAHADSVSVNFMEYDDSPWMYCLDDYDYVEPANNWHNLTQIGNGTDLLMNSGRTSTIDFSMTGDEWATFDWGGTLNYTPMASGITLYGTGSLTISDINSTFRQYDIIVYVTGWNLGENVGGFSDGATTYYCETPNPYTASLIQSTDTDISDGGDEGTYVRFNDLTADSVTITISAPAGSTGIGGFQIVGPDRGAAYLLLPQGIINKDFDDNEVSWISGDVPDDPNLTVNSFDLKYYSKPVANVTPADPNITHPVNTVVGATSPHALVLDYETAYFWRVDSNVTWDSNTPATIRSRFASFEVEPSEVPPKVYIGPDGGRTWLDKPILLPTTVHEKGPVSAEWYEWMVTGPATYTGDPSLFLTNTTLVDMGSGVWEVTAEFTPSGTDPNIIGYYEIELTATDLVPTSSDDFMYITVHETPCDVYVESGNVPNDFDANMDCEITLDDYAAWAATWLEDKNPSDPYVY